MSEAVKLIREFGFPTLFCLWLMWRDGKRQQMIVENMNKMLTLLAIMNKTLDEGEGPYRRKEMRA